MTDEKQLTQLEIACGGALMVVRCPATIIMRDASEYHVDQLDAWGYTPTGVFAAGTWGEYGEPAPRIFASDVIHHIELDTKRYEELTAPPESDEDDDS